jgi:hypothetical protein
MVFFGGCINKNIADTWSVKRGASLYIAFANSWAQWPMYGCVPKHILQSIFVAGTWCISCEVRTDFTYVKKAVPVLAY